MKLDKYRLNLLKDKNQYVNYFINKKLSELVQMFTYENLPETIPVVQMERLLMTNGSLGIVKHDDNIYALLGTAGGEIDAYFLPTKYTIANPFLNISKMYEIGKDCVFLKNDSSFSSVIPILEKYAMQINESDISLNMIATLSRMQFLISASDDKTKESAERFIKKLVDGDFSVIGENAFFDGVKMQNTIQNNNITQMITLINYFNASLYNYFGLNANNNLKKERVSNAEYDLSSDYLLPYCENMLAERVLAWNKANEMFDLNVKVDLSSTWKILQQEVNDQKTEVTENETFDMQTETTENAISNEQTETPPKEITEANATVDGNTNENDSDVADTTETTETAETETTENEIVEMKETVDEIKETVEEIKETIDELKDDKEVTENEQ